MAFSATTEWDVRTTGSDANGGGFDTASSGTDYSIQDSPQVTYTDMVIDGATATKFTSAGNPVTAAHVGNIINVTSGTGFSVQRVQIVSQAAGVATCDKSLGTLSSTGGNGNLGGGLATVVLAATKWADSNTIHIKAGTYTGAVTWTINSAAFVGYQTTHNDRGTKPLITIATNALLMVDNGGTYTRMTNISFSSTSGTRNICLYPAAGQNYFVDGCVFDGFSYAMFGDNGSRGYFAQLFVANTEIKNCTTGGVYDTGTVAIHFWDCWFHGNTGDAIATAQARVISVVRCILSGNTRGVAAANSSTLAIRNCAIANNTDDGIDCQGAPTFLSQNNIIYGNGGWGIDMPAASATIVLVNRNNAYGANTSGNRNNSLPAGVSDVALTATPFTSSSDFTLNNTAGGGAACKAAGFEWVF